MALRSQWRMHKINACFYNFFQQGSVAENNRAGEVWRFMGQVQQNAEGLSMHRNTSPMGWVGCMYVCVSVCQSQALGKVMKGNRAKR